MELLRGCSSDFRLEELRRPFSWVRHRQQSCLGKMCPDGEPPTEGVWAAGGSEKVPSIRKTEGTETSCSKQNLQGIHSTQPNKNSSDNKSEGRGRNNAEECNLAMARTWRRKTVPSKPEISWDCFVALQTEEALDIYWIQTSVKHLTQSPTAFSCSNWLHMAWTRVFLFGWKTGWLHLGSGDKKNYIHLAAGH